MGPRRDEIMIIVPTVRAFYVSRKVSNTGEGDDDTGCGVFVRDGGRASRQARKQSGMQVVIRTQ